MGNYAVIKNAVLNKHSLTALYKQHIRKFCPHRIGWDADGEEHVLAYQYGGSSSSSLPSDGEWRCFKVNEFHRIETNLDEWRSGTSSGNPNNCVLKVDTEV